MDLFRKEFLFDRYDEFTGKVLFTRKVDALSKDDKEQFKHEYRGITLYFKEIIESVLSIILLFTFLVLLGLFCWNYLFNKSFSIDMLDIENTANSISDFSKYVLNIAGGILILDSLLLIAALISSPGIDETIDSISVTIAGVLLLIIGKNDSLIEKPELILKVVVPLSFVVVILIFTKHILRKMNKSEANRQIEGGNSG
jgi:hypothetical protein